MRELELLAKKHKRWCGLVRSMGCNTSLIEDVVQDSYLKIREQFSGLRDEIKDAKVKIGPQKCCTKTTKLGRNEPCLCGSNLKYKNCCGK